MSSGFDARASSQRGSYFDYLLDGDPTVVADTSVTAVIGKFGERISLGQPVRHLYICLPAYRVPKRSKKVFDGPVKLNRRWLSKRFPEIDLNTVDSKRRSRSAARAAKSLRWSI